MSSSSTRCHALAVSCSLYRGSLRSCWDSTGFGSMEQRASSTATSLCSGRAIGARMLPLNPCAGADSPTRRERESDDRDCALVVARCFLIGRSPANQKLVSSQGCCNPMKASSFRLRIAVAFGSGRSRCSRRRAPTGARSACSSSFSNPSLPVMAGHDWPPPNHPMNCAHFEKTSPCEARK